MADLSSDDIERLRILAGIRSSNLLKPYSVNEEKNISSIGTEKAEYMRAHKIRPGTDEWFKLWFSRPKLTGENPMPKE